MSRQPGRPEGRGAGATDRRQAPTQPEPPSPTNLEAEEQHYPTVEANEVGGDRPTAFPTGDIPSSPVGDTDSDGLAEREADPLSAVLAERDEYLDALRRLQADFENYRKRMAKAQSEQVERAAGDLVSKLLPVLDTLDMALAHLAGADTPASGAQGDRVSGGLGSPELAERAQAAGAASLIQVGCALTEVLTRAGLERIDPAGQAFDPTEHDAVVLDSEGDAAESEVTEVLRAGYRWKGRVLRPAMVKVKG